MQSVGGDRVEGGTQGQLRGGARGEEYSTVAHNRHVEVVGQGNLEAFLWPPKKTVFIGFGIK